MKKIIFVLLLAAAAGSMSMRWTNNNNNIDGALSNIESINSQQLNSLDSFLADYPKYFYDSSLETRIRKYEELVYLFKRSVAFIAYFEPDYYFKKITSPFQFDTSAGRKGRVAVIPDKFLIAGPVGNEPDSLILKGRSFADTTVSAQFIREASSYYRKAFVQFNWAAHFNNIRASDIFDALRMEIFRISSVDIANADFWVHEAAISSLNGSVDSWLLYTNELVNQLPDSRAPLQERWEYLYMSTKKFLAGHKDFISFNRMSFIKNQLIPLSGFLNELQVAMDVPYKQKWSAIRSDAKHIYDKNIFNTDFFAPNEDAHYSEAKAKLGELLFFDPILSDNNLRSCASCHKPGMAYTDGLAKSLSFEKTDLPRNAPTVINSGFQKKQFWDMRATSLEDQLDSVINNPHELNSSFNNVIDKINRSPEYVKLFHRAFPKTILRGIEKEDVKNAIGVYERTLTGLNSRFDQYMQGDLTRMTEAEINGFNIFMGKAKCGVCHTAPLFSAAIPPFYEETDHHSLGVPKKDTMEKYAIDADRGVFQSTKNRFTKFSFKVPTIRNIALTAPYMHNGVFKTAEQVIEFYNNGAGHKFTKDMRPGMEGLPFFTILPNKLQLTETEKKELVSFFNSLTDTTTAGKVPKRLPKMVGKYAELNSRKIGGEY